MLAPLLHGGAMQAFLGLIRAGWIILGMSWWGPPAIYWYLKPSKLALIHVSDVTANPFSACTGSVKHLHRKVVTRVAAHHCIFAVPPFLSSSTSFILCFFVSLFASRFSPPIHFLIFPLCFSNFRLFCFTPLPIGASNHYSHWFIQAYQQPL